MMKNTRLSLNTECELNVLSIYRQELMGISAVLILMCHSAAFIKFPTAIAYLLSLGNIGVDVFLFLSGMGLFYSLSKADIHICNVGGVVCWYRHRFIRLFVPYLLIVLTLDAYGAYCSGESIDAFILRVSTLSFWTDHNAYWFMALLIPMYLAAPFLFLYMRKKALLMTLCISLLCFVLALFPLEKIGISCSILTNIQFVTPRIPCFILGLYMGEKIKRGESIKFSFLVCCLFFAFGTLLFTRHLVYTYFF